eukprot:3284785-Prymnesium_polylepis.2
MGSFNDEKSELIPRAPRSSPATYRCSGSPLAVFGCPGPVRDTTKRANAAQPHARAATACSRAASCNASAQHRRRRAPQHESLCERMSMTGCPHPNDTSAPRVLTLHEHLTWPGVT